ncbi:glycosyltransferase family 2 protein [Micromonospora costi]|uniref:Glycosyltransferase family 2 protein n=1 Tax=Micromonospora costi TaxID=1530042 RepID=A0A3A9ZU05_9ACTN|nr:glycosyltransferase family 2 protein [Micromonospora costi]RKN51778.1 glycosyltransferase family 2 protein [Micromonospora costi]
MNRPQVSAVMLAYGAEPWLVDAARAVLASTDVDVELIVVDNGCTSDGIDVVKGLPGVRVLRPEENTGYSGGCRVGAAEATGEWLAFVNSDAIVAPDALAKVVAVAAEPGVGAAMASIRLAENPDLINTSGNPLHFIGLSWAGGNGEPATAHARRTTVPSLSGCCFVINRELWRELDGFAAEYFAYHEDTEISLRLWQRGLRLEYVPDAVVVHHYEFSRNSLKVYLVERNRLLSLLTAYETRTLVLLAPMLLLSEAALLAASLLGGWSREKVRGWRWLWTNRAWVRARRRQLQAERIVPDGVIAEMMTAKVDPSNVEAPPGMAVFNVIAAAYWALTKPLLRRR